MKPLQNRPTDPDRLRTALEESCAALIALESTRARMTDSSVDPSGVQQLGRAIESLRQAIAQLRMASATEATVLALDFVLEANADQPPAA